MSPKQYRSLAKYIKRCCVIYGLSEWHGELHTDPPANDSAIASVETAYGRKIAVIRVCADFDEYEPQVQRCAIVHELTHIHEAQMIDLIDDRLPEALGKPAFVMFEAGWRQAMEHTTDAIATAIAPMFPLWEGA